MDPNAYREMLDRSLLSMGNNRRLKAAIEKANRGEDVTIACIGGSITHPESFERPQRAGCHPLVQRVRKRLEFAGAIISHRLALWTSDGKHQGCGDHVLVALQQHLSDASRAAEIAVHSYRRSVLLLRTFR